MGVFERMELLLKLAIQLPWATTTDHTDGTFGIIADGSTAAGNLSDEHSRIVIVPSGLNGQIARKIVEDHNAARGSHN